MTLRRVGLLALLLLSGLTIEGVWRARSVGLGPTACHFISGRFSGPSHELVREERHTIPESVTALEIVGSVGDVRVEGGETDEVRVTLLTRVYLEESAADRAQELAELTRVAVVTVEDRLRIEVRRREAERREPEVGIETHVTVLAPRRLAVQVRNQHGDVWLSGVRRADVDSAHGSVSVDDVAESAAVRHRHGEAAVHRVGGATDVEIRFGRAVVSQIAGPVRAVGEQGRVDIEGAVGAEVRLDRADLTVRDVRESLKVEGRHAGIEIEGVQGVVDVVTSFRDVRVVDLVQGGRLRASHGKVSAELVAGPLVIAHEHGDVRLAEISGPVDVTLSHGAVDARALTASTTVRVDGGDCNIDDASGPIDVSVQRGQASAQIRGPLTAPVTLAATHGNVRLELPRTSTFTLDALAGGGKVEIDFPGYEPRESDRNRAAGHVGSDGPQVQLRTERGDITLSAVD